MWGYFGSRHGVNIPVSRQMGLLSLPDTWITPGCIHHLLSTISQNKITLVSTKAQKTKEETIKLLAFLVVEQKWGCQGCHDSSFSACRWQKEVRTWWERFCFTYKIVYAYSRWVFFFYNIDMSLILFKLKPLDDCSCLLAILICFSRLFAEQRHSIADMHRHAEEQLTWCQQSPSCHH